MPENWSGWEQEYKEYFSNVDFKLLRQTVRILQIVPFL